ncbi:MAG TPA: hypothetical protein VGG72_01550 [Bryobacteraceae bacterium]|jgi:hypothetical protein
MSSTENIDSANLILAAEECDPQEFAKFHRFSANDARVINKLIAHGPVLLQGGRGCGKSALMIAASQQLAPFLPSASVFGVYLSLRHMPLLRSFGKEYEAIFCGLVSQQIQLSLRDTGQTFESADNIASLQYGIASLSRNLGKRIVLLFDDAAHIGREASLEEFFDIFRTISSSTVSCKATIYPGVTNFGKRFDVYNDASVVDVVRDEEQPGFDALFAEILTARFPNLANREIAAPLKLDRAAGFVGQSVLGNMRGFVFACNELADRTADRSIGLTILGETLLGLAMNYYWPLLEEVSPKLGKYVPMVEPARQIAEAVLQECGSKTPVRRHALIHREIVTRLPKPFEILEYAGFLSKRESSRALKSGGRGSRFAVNLCLLLEHVPGTRLTSELFDRWKGEREEPVEFHVRGSQLAGIANPELLEKSDLEILNDSIEKLKKSRAYPYGLTDHMIETLKSAGINTVGDLSRARDEDLDRLDYVGEATIRRMRNVVGQAVWM